MEQTPKNPIVHLRLYEGKKITYKQNGEIDNKSRSYKEKYYSKSFSNFLTTAAGYCRVDVEKVIDKKGEGWYDEKLIEKVREDIQKAMNPNKEKPLTPDQKRIKELEEKINNIISNSELPEKKIEAVTEKIEEKTEDPELENLREQYEAKFNRKPHNKMSINSLIAKLAE